MRVLRCNLDSLVYSYAMSSQPLPRRWLVLATLIMGLLTIAITSAQVRRSHVYPSFEGWEPNPDKTANLVFGYMAEVPPRDGPIDIPLGQDNRMDPGPDRGQPSTFYPLRQKDVFKIVVPADFPGKITWTLVFRGETQKATGSLNPIYALGGDTEFGPATPAGTIAVNAGADQSLTLPSPAMLSATVRDNRPAPAQGRSLRPAVVTWRKYRGPGAILFAPPSSSPAGGSATTTATFSAPGNYMVQAIVAAGGINAKDVVAISVAPAAR